MQTTQLNEIWTNEFGNQYTDRNSDASLFCLRAPFWAGILKQTQPKNILEVGCNLGGNLPVLKLLAPQVQITAIEPNQYAANRCQQSSHGQWTVQNASIFNADLSPQSFDLVYTTNVLIHIASQDLLAATKKIVDLSRGYVLAVEYYWPQVKEVKYRGLDGALWKRDFGLFYLENFKNLELMDTGYVDQAQGFDRSTWWLFKKK